MMRFSLVLALLLTACTSPATPTPTVLPSRSPTVQPTATPAPTVDAQLGVACKALTELRQVGTLVQVAGSGLGGDYTTDWTPAATALLDQVNSTTNALKAVDSNGAYQHWKQEALLIILEVTNTVEQWDTGLLNNDAAAITDGNTHLAAAKAETDTMNLLAGSFEASC